MNWIVCGLLGAIGGPLLMVGTAYGWEHPSIPLLLVLALVLYFLWVAVAELCRHIFDPRSKAVSQQWRAECVARSAREALDQLQPPSATLVRGVAPSQLRAAVPDRRASARDSRPVPTGGPRWRALDERNAD